MTDHFNELSKSLNLLGRRYDLSRVFNALLTMGICAFHRTNIQSRLQEKDEANETLYLETIKPYSREDLETFGRAMGTLQLNVLDDPYSDLLGEFFMQEITKGQNGQYFTPTHVCDMMASMQCGNLEDGGSRVLDPACGSGRMLLSAAKLSHHNYFFGADNSNSCAKMAAINFFLNGLNGEVSWMNSLSMEWYGGWHINTNGVGIIPIEKVQSQIWSEAPKVQKSKSEQLTLF